MNNILFKKLKYVESFKINYQPLVFRMSQSEQFKSTAQEKLNEKPKERLKDVMKNLERKFEPKSVAEGLTKLVTAIQTNEPSILSNPIVEGAKEFEQRIGRPMTYSEMREMWG